jgi:peptidoglycan/LPS O-acetylase OafA/YrhL
MPIETQTASPEPARYAVLDSWRFIAALGVVAYHYESHFASVAATPSHRLFMFGYFVDFFFVLSGFVLMHTYGDRVKDVSAYRDFMQKRLARVYPLHAAVTLIFGVVAVYLAVAGVKMRDAATMDPGLIAPHLLLIQAWGFGWQPGLNFPSWSISSELFVYLLFPVFATILVKRGPLTVLAIALLFAAVMEWVRLALGMQSFTQATWDFGMLRAVPTFLAGMAVQRIVVALPRIALPWWIAHSFMACVLALLVLQANIYFILVAFVAAVGLLAATERGGAKTIFQHPFCVMLGDASYAVYLLHTMFQVATLMLARKLGFTQWPELIAIAMVGTVIIVITSIACYRWFESPARRLLSGSGTAKEKLGGAAPVAGASQ